MSLTLQFVPYSEIDDLPSAKRIQKILKIVKTDKIVLLEGKLKAAEETELIHKTMEEIDDNFKGIELAVIYPEQKSLPLFKKLRHNLMNALLGDRKGLTVIGPATVVKEIKQDPEKILLYTE
jgi:hypothetical protein